MNYIFSLIKSSLCGSFTKILSLLLSVVKCVSSFLDYKKQKNTDKKNKKFESNVDQVVDKGSISDLLDLKRLSIIGVFSLTLCGCFTKEIVVQPVKNWEGHFYTVQEFRKNTENMELDKNESIWVLSNTTLKRVLKNTSK